MKNSHDISVFCSSLIYFLTRNNSIVFILVFWLLPLSWRIERSILIACTRLYKSVHPFVCPSVSRSITLLSMLCILSITLLSILKVENTYRLTGTVTFRDACTRFTYGDRPFLFISFFFTIAWLLTMTDTNRQMTTFTYEQLNTNTVRPVKKTRMLEEVKSKRV